jgi:hypothetical protein
MSKARIFAASIGLMAALVATPVHATLEWCLRDPAVTIVTPGGSSSVVYVTEGALGTEHAPALSAAQITYSTPAWMTAQANSTSGSGTAVVLNDLVPTDASGSFPTEMTVSSQPMGGGIVYGATTGRSGSPMTVIFTLPGS